MKKWIIRCVITIVMMSIVMLLFSQRQVGLSFAAFLSMFYMWFLTFGHFKDRIRNSLPFFAIFGYLYLGISFGLWTEATWLFFAVPLLSLMLKPKRNVLKYLTMFLSVALFIYAWWFDQQVPLYTRIVLITLIYTLFFPPYMIFRFERMFHRAESKIKA